MCDIEHTPFTAVMKTGVGKPMKKLGNHSNLRQLLADVLVLKEHTIPNANIKRLIQFSRESQIQPEFLKERRTPKVANNIPKRKRECWGQKQKIRINIRPEDVMLTKRC